MNCYVYPVVCEPISVRCSTAKILYYIVLMLRLLDQREYLLRIA